MVWISWKVQNIILLRGKLSVRKFVKDKPFYIITTYVFHSLKSILQSHDSARHEKYRLSVTQSKKFNQRKTLG